VIAIYFVSYNCGGEDLFLCKSYPGKAIVFKDIEDAKTVILKSINEDKFKLKHNYKILNVICEQK